MQPRHSAAFTESLGAEQGPPLAEASPLSDDREARLGLPRPLTPKPEEMWVFSWTSVELPRLLNSPASSMLPS